MHVVHVDTLQEFSYNEHGGVVRSALRHADAQTPQIVSSTAYQHNGNHILSQTDARGKTVTHDIDENTDLTRAVTDPNGQQVQYAYDGLGRLSTRKVYVNGNAYTTAYAYTPGAQEGQTTALVQEITQPGENHSYAYDNVGNIVSAARNGITTTYGYDALGQLIRVNDPEDGTWTYAYDCGGNILNKKRYAYTTGEPGEVQQTVSYEYGDGNWKDKLTAFNGQAITYDAIGNPTNDGAWTYAWENGRQLARMTSADTIAEFAYNADGLRVQKTVNGVTTDYTLHGKDTVHITQGNAELHFWYDAQNRPAIVEFNGTKYGYLYNLQGDVIGLIDGANNEVVRYTYDAWGKPLSVTGSLANTIGYYNPFRYRGYVYDVETGLYYLRSRYHDSCRARFLNADIRLACVGAILHSNTMTYASNSPVMRVDILGCADYVYSDKDNFHVENDWGIFEFLNINRYFVEIGGVRYRANSKETAELTNWNAIDLDFTTSTLDNLVETADMTPYSFTRVLHESVEGDLDFKYQLSDSKLYYDPNNKVLYNKNEAGNYAWAYYLTLHGYSDLQGILTQGGSIIMQGRLDEPWDYRARWAGVEAAFERMGELWAYYVIYELFGQPQF